MLKQSWLGRGEQFICGNGQSAYATAYVYSLLALSGDGVYERRRKDGSWTSNVTSSWRRCGGLHNSVRLTWHERRARCDVTMRVGDSVDVGTYVRWRWRRSSSPKETKERPWTCSLLESIAKGLHILLSLTCLFSFFFEECANMSIQSDIFLGWAYQVIAITFLSVRLNMGKFNKILHMFSLAFQG